MAARGSGQRLRSICIGARGTDGRLHSGCTEGKVWTSWVTRMIFKIDYSDCVHLRDLLGCFVKYNVVNRLIVITRMSNLFLMYSLMDLLSNWLSGREGLATLWTLRGLLNASQTTTSWRQLWVGQQYNNQLTERERERERYDQLFEEKPPPAAGVYLGEPVPAGDVTTDRD